LPIENPKAAIAHDAEVVCIQLSAARRLEVEPTVSGELVRLIAVQPCEKDQRPRYRRGGRVAVALRVESVEKSR